MRRRVVAASVVLVLVVGACSTGDEASVEPDARFRQALAAQATDGVTTVARSPEGDLTVRTLSTRADAVTGDDVLIGIDGPVVDDEVVVTVDDAEVPAEVVDGQVLVTGLDEGANLVEVSDGDRTAALAIENHPPSGPVFAGPHLQPWVCHTEDVGLGPSQDDDCTVDPVVTTETRRTAGGDEVAMTVERGVIARGIYTIALPADPDDWNGRLVYRFGGGCGTTYGQGFDLGSGIDAGLVARGYATATNTLNTFQTLCNPTVSAEAALLTRERFAESYGVPVFTIGDGGSGGAIQQLLIAQNHPGLLDALAPAAPFPDALSIAAGVTDCGLLVEYWRTDTGAALTEAQRAAVSGHLTSATCAAWDRLFVDGVDPTVGCDPAIPPADLWSDANPDGVRCTLQDSNVAVLGTDPATGHARRPLSNEGVQYGLVAFRAGIIDAEAFVALNEGIGGYDIDGRIVAERTSIDDETAALAYQVGAVAGSDTLRQVPIILRAPYTDAFGDIHTRYHAFSIRERLRVDGMDAPDLVLWTSAAGGGDLVGTLTGDVGGDDHIAVLDEWLTTGERPEAAVNRCTLEDATVVEGGWEVYDRPGPCRAAFPVYGDPRVAAGGPRRGDVIACRLAPVREVDGDLDLTEEHLARLEAVFPTGVCDWTRPGRGAGPPEATWVDWTRG